jgi:hypothetical protein
MRIPLFGEVENYGCEKEDGEGRQICWQDQSQGEEEEVISELLNPGNAVGANASAAFSFPTVASPRRFVAIRSVCPDLGAQRASKTAVAIILKHGSAIAEPRTFRNSGDGRGRNVQPHDGVGAGFDRRRLRRGGADSR